MCASIPVVYLVVDKTGGTVSSTIWLTSPNWWGGMRQIGLVAGTPVLSTTDVDYDLLVDFDLPGRGLMVNFCKEYGEMRWKKLIFTGYFLHLFAVNAVNRGESFILTAFTAITAFLTNIHRIHRIYY